MIIDIEPFVVSRTGIRLQLQIPVFELGANDGNVYVAIETESGITIHTENVYIPPDVYADWGQDDRFIANYVMRHLNIIERQGNIHQ